MKHLLCRRLIYWIATKTNWIRQVVFPNIFCVTLTRWHLPGMDSSDGPNGARHVFYFDSTQEPNAGTSRVWRLLSAVKKGKTQHQHCVTGRRAHLPHGRLHAAAPRLCPCLFPFKPSGSAAAVSGWLLSRPALASQHVAVPALRSPHGAAVEQGRRLRGPRCGRPAPARGRGRSTGSLREGAGPRAPGALTRSMKVRNFQLPP